MQRLSPLLASLLLLTGCTNVKTTWANWHHPKDQPILASHVPPPPPREFRAAWVASVANIDWPSRPDLSVAQQLDEMRAVLDRASELNLNALILQVRPAGDALYA